MSEDVKTEKRKKMIGSLKEQMKGKLKLIKKSNLEVVESMGEIQES